MHADTPKPWQLDLPFALIYDNTTSEIAERGLWMPSCGIDCYALIVTQYDPYMTSLSGIRSDDEISIAGVQNRMSTTYIGISAGGLTSPTENLLPDDPTIRYYIAATSVPEPGQYALLFAGIPLVWWGVSSQRRQVS